jgi:hypothetical protein
MNQDEIKHLDYIQAIITRMNINSFQLKGWCVTIFAALLAVYASTKNELFILASLIPTALFWLLDTYYLMQERKFRGLYRDISGTSKHPKSLKTFEMRPDLYVGGKYCFLNVFISGTIIFLYLPISAFTLTSYFYLVCQGA